MKINGHTISQMGKSKIIFNQLNDIINMLEIDLQNENILIQGLAIWISENLICLGGNLIQHLENIGKERKEQIKEEMIQIIENLTKEHKKDCDIC